MTDTVFLFSIPLQLDEGFHYFQQRYSLSILRGFCVVVCDPRVFLKNMVKNLNCPSLTWGIMEREKNLPWDEIQVFSTLPRDVSNGK